MNLTELLLDYEPALCGFVVGLALTAALWLSCVLDAHRRPIKALEATELPTDGKSRVQANLVRQEGS
jgi:hypothetical protein